MKVTGLAIAPTDEAYLREGIAGYTSRLSRYLNFEYRELDIRNKKTHRREDILEAERTEILKWLKPSDHLVLLDEKGQEMNSVAFAGWLQKRFNEGTGNLVFLIGGPFGFDEEIKKRANSTLSLSKMTFTHQMVRLFFLEQLYRGMTILRNEKYHHE